MASAVAENGDNIEEMQQSDDSSVPKVNGEINGSYEEPMEIDGSHVVKPVKKTNMSDNNVTSEHDSNSESEHLEETNLVSENSVVEMDTVPESEVPEGKDDATSNGFSEEQQEDDNTPEEKEPNEVRRDSITVNEEVRLGDNEMKIKNPPENEVSNDKSLLDSETEDPLSETPDNINKIKKDEGKEKEDIDTVVNESNGPENMEDVAEIKVNDDVSTESVVENNDDCEPTENINPSNQTETDSENNQNINDSCDKNTNEIVDENKELSESDTKDISSNIENDPLGESTKEEEDGNKNVTPVKSRIEEETEKTSDKVKKKKVVQQPTNITPRRSSRNVNKPKTYIDEPDIKDNSGPKKVADDPDIEEIVPQDPLAMDSPISDKKNKKAVVVNDPKRLAEIASGNKQATKVGKKEPTLVIIDTNSILSGRGPVPVSPASPNMAGPSQAYSVLPVALPAQGMYPHAMRHTQIKPVPSPAAVAKTPPSTIPLTDDMFVVEAPSFIVPYVYESPPINPLKSYVEEVEKAIMELKSHLKKEKEVEKKKEKACDDEKDSVDENEESNEKEDSEEVNSGQKSEGKSKGNEDTRQEEKSEDKSSEKTTENNKSEESDKVKKHSNSYFDNPLGKFFIQIGVNLVQEHVQTDLLRSQKRKKEREGSKCTPEVQQAMNSLIRSLEFSKETNEPFKLDLKKCEFCSFKTESSLVMAHHLETPHMRNYVYQCNFCSLEVRSPHDILYHMEAEHNVRGRLERAPAFHQCPSCPFEDNQKGKLSRHLLSCAKKYRPERNQEPPLDFEPPAKIPRVSRNRPNSMSPGTAVYQAAMSGLKQGAAGHPLLPKLIPAPTAPGMARGRGRPQMINRYLGDMRSTSLAAQQKAMAAQMRPGMLYRPSGTNAQPQVLLPASYQLAGTQLYQDQMSLYQQMVSNHSRGLASAPLALPNQNSTVASSKSGVGSSTAKLLQQPSISITPLPRQQPPPPSSAPIAPASKPGRPAGNSKATFVICEICDGYIKDLEQLRNHMQWIHKVKIHPKMIYNRPPLNCQKCQFRFFTDQGLERHLLGSHGLVTSSMQEAANKGKDGGRCPVCGRVYQWKLLNHVARDHNMSLKPAHLSYKCTVCTATFGMYKQFENHVYSAHSVVAKRVMDKKPSTSAQASTSSAQGDMLKPLKINDEITIIPQPARSKTKPSTSRNPQKKV